MTFPTESERQRAREAAYAFHKERCRAIHVEVYDDTFDRLYPPVVEPAAQEVTVDIVRRDCWRDTTGKAHPKADATPSPAFAAAVLAFGNAECDCGLWEEDDEDMPHPYQHYLDIANAARAALVRCHLEEVERGR